MARISNKSVRWATIRAKVETRDLAREIALEMGFDSGSRCSMNDVILIALKDLAKKNKRKKDRRLR